jgi:chromosome segregation ATPase
MKTKIHTIIEEITKNYFNKIDKYEKDKNDNCHKLSELSHNYKKLYSNYKDSHHGDNHNLKYKLKKCMEEHNKCKNNIYKLEIEINKLKEKCHSLEKENHDLKKENKYLKDKIGKLLEILNNIKY